MKLYTVHKKQKLPIKTIHLADVLASFHKAKFFTGPTETAKDKIKAHLKKFTPGKV